MRFVEQAMRKKRSLSNTTSRDVNELSLFCFKNTIVDYRNLESKNVIWDVFRQNSIVRASSLKLRSVFKILQEIDFFVVWIRSLIQKTLMKQRKNENNREDSKSILSQAWKTINSISNQKWILKNEILCWNNKWYILLKLLRRELLKQNHDDFFVKHFEFKRTFVFTKRKYFWTNLIKNMKQHVNNCSTCYRVKSIRHKSHDLLQLLFQSKNSRQNWIMNFIIDLSSSKHRVEVYNSVLIMMNRYTKYVRYISTKKTWTIENLMLQA